VNSKNQKNQTKTTTIQNEQNKKMVNGIYLNGSHLGKYIKYVVLKFKTLGFIEPIRHLYYY